MTAISLKNRSNGSGNNAVDRRARQEIECIFTQNRPVVFTNLAAYPLPTDCLNSGNYFFDHFPGNVS